MMLCYVTDVRCYDMIQYDRIQYNSKVYEMKLTRILVFQSVI